MPDPLAGALKRLGTVVLDGGLATELEARGHRLDDALWSARILLDRPDAIRDVHLAYLRAGADCVTTATYQASHPGLALAGLSADDADEVLRRASRLATEACAAFRTEASARGDAVEPLVAASVGPYGAYLADGSEYEGRYVVDDAELDAFHRRRFGVLAGSGVDLLACETLPNLREARVLLAILDDHPEARAWMSFSCRDGDHLRDGSPFSEAVRVCAAHEGVVAIGVNCTEPRHVPELVSTARRLTDKPTVVYANSGEQWDAAGHRWVGQAEEGGGVDTGGGSRDGSWRTHTAAAWREGARIVGGCCRVGPASIAWLRRAARSGDWSVSSSRRD